MRCSKQKGGPAAAPFRYAGRCRSETDIGCSVNFLGDASARTSSCAHSEQHSDARIKPQ